MTKERVSLIEYSYEEFLKSDPFIDMNINNQLIIKKFLNSLTKGSINRGIDICIKLRKNKTIVICGSPRNSHIAKRKTLNMAIISLNKDSVRIVIDKLRSNKVFTYSKEIDDVYCNKLLDFYKLKLVEEKVPITTYISKYTFNKIKDLSKAKKIKVNAIISNTINLNFNFFANNDHEQRFNWYLRIFNIRSRDERTIYKSAAFFYLISGNLFIEDRYTIDSSNKTIKLKINPDSNITRDELFLCKFAEDLHNSKNIAIVDYDYTLITDLIIKLKLFNAIKIAMGFIDVNDSCFLPIKEAFNKLRLNQNYST